MALLKFHLWSINTASLKNQSFLTTLTEEFQGKNHNLLRRRGVEDIHTFGDNNKIIRMTSANIFRIITKYHCLFYYKFSKKTAHFTRYTIS